MNEIKEFYYFLSKLYYQEKEFVSELPKDNCNIFFCMYSSDINFSISKTIIKDGGIEDLADGVMKQMRANISLGNPPITVSRVYTERLGTTSRIRYELHDGEIDDVSHFIDAYNFMEL